MSKLHFFHAVMQGGKSTQLLQVNHNYLEKGFKTLILKPTLDTRDGNFNGKGYIKSRVFRDPVDCLYVNKITKDLVSSDIDIILVDEVQFFNKEDIWELSDIVDELNIPVLCYGLKTDCNGALFEGSAALLALADNIVELKQICRCGEKATMHVRFVDNKLDTNKSSIVIEQENVTYESVCRKCFKNYYKK